MFTFSDFEKAIADQGFLFFSDTPWGFPSASSLTRQEQWFTGIPETDPWDWRCRAAASGNAAYGHFIEHRLCFLSKDTLPYFIAAGHVWEEPAYRYEIGSLDKETLLCWERLEQGPAMKADLRKAMHLEGKEAGRVDRSLLLLQSTFDAGIVGETQKTNKNGQKYGWMVNVFDSLSHAFPESFDIAARLDRKEARRFCRELALRSGGDADACAFFAEC